MRFIAARISLLRDETVSGILFRKISCCDVRRALRVYFCCKKRVCQTAKNSSVFIFYIFFYVGRAQLDLRQCFGQGTPSLPRLHAQTRCRGRTGVWKRTFSSLLWQQRMHRHHEGSWPSISCPSKDCPRLFDLLARETTTLLATDSHSSKSMEIRLLATYQDFESNSSAGTSNTLLVFGNSKSRGRDWQHRFLMRSTQSSNWIGSMLHDHTRVYTCTYSSTGTRPRVGCGASYYYCNSD